MRLLPVYLCIAALSSTAMTSPSQGSHRRLKAQRPALPQTLFSCHTDAEFDLRPSIAGDPSQHYVAGGQDKEQSDVKLTFDAQSHRIFLQFAQINKSSQNYLLHDVEQGSSAGSGAGGQIDTTIRGRSGGSIYTIFASSDNHGFESDSSIMINGGRNSLLSCKDGRFDADNIKISKSMTTNIFVLTDSGFAEKMTDFPIEPTIPRAGPKPIKTIWGPIH